MNREVRRKMKAAKEEWTEEQCKSIEKGMLFGTIPSSLSPRANSISQQSSKTAAEKKTLTESKAVLNQWTEYCSDLYNYRLHPDTSLLQSN